MFPKSSDNVLFWIVDQVTISLEIQILFGAPMFYNRITKIDLPLGLMLWLLGAYGPYILKCIFNIFGNIKNSKRKIHVYIFTCYVRTKSFHENLTCVWAV
jgi:hypothetical protein